VVKEVKKLNYADKLNNSLNRNITIWEIVKLETNKTRNTDKTTALNIGGTSISNHQVTANEFNKYFLSIAKNISTNKNDPNGHKLNTTTPMHYLPQSFKTPFPNIKLTFLSSKEVENMIKSLKTKNSSGHDGISTKLLKISTPFIGSPLTHICNELISAGIFPDRCKYAVAKP
jgi:hypothetical protein